MSKQRNFLNIINEDTLEKFSEAIIQGDIDLVKSLIEQGVDVNSTHILYIEKGEGMKAQLLPIKTTSLLLAVQAGHTEVVKLLLDKQANPATLGSLGEDKTLVLSNGKHGVAAFDHGYTTPLFAALRIQSPEIVEMLVKCGADFMQPLNSHQDSPLMWAATMGQTEILKIFLEHGANPNSVNEFGRSLLFQAIQSGNANLVKLLLDKGANTFVDSDLFPLIFIAASLGYADIVEILLGKDINVNDAHLGETLLCKAAAGGHLEVVKMLINKGADVNGRYSKELVPNAFVPYYSYPLERAASEGQIEVVKTLIKNSAEYEIDWMPSYNCFSAKEEYEDGEAIAKIYDAAKIADRIFKAKKVIIKENANSYYLHKNPNPFDNIDSDIVVSRLNHKLMKFGLPNKYTVEGYKDYLKYTCLAQLPKELSADITNEQGTGVVDRLEQSIVQVSNIGQQLSLPTHTDHKVLTHEVAERLTTKIDGALSKMLQAGTMSEDMQNLIKLLETIDNTNYEKPDDNIRLSLPDIVESHNDSTQTEIIGAGRLDNE